MTRCNTIWIRVGILVVCLIGCAALASADTPSIPPIPCEFYGHVVISGLAAPAGTVITAYIDDQPRGSITTTTTGFYGGAGTFDSRLSILNGSESDIGKTIVFRVNGNQANETALFTAGGGGRLNLTAILSGPQPVSRFTQNITSGMVPLTVLFTDTSDCLNPTGWSWDFGDGTTLPMVQNPLHTYTMPGTHIVRLTVSNSTGSNTTGTGTTITVFPRGDFNNNWRVDISDVTSVAYMVVGLIKQDPRADFHNGNGTVVGGDAAKIAWYYIGKITDL
jgi:PKD repeat protein